MVVREGMILVGGGLAVGLALAYLITQPLETFLAAQVGSADPLSFLTVSIISLTVGLAASIVPARRAARVDPATALRND
jgi:ABC-type antimicrobial peptide transport system permease subunit